MDYRPSENDHEQDDPQPLISTAAALIRRDGGDDVIRLDQNRLGESQQTSGESKVEERTGDQHDIQSGNDVVNQDDDASGNDHGNDHDRNRHGQHQRRVGRRAIKKHVRKPAILRMNNSLLEETEKLRRLWADAEVTNSIKRYEIAVRCERVRSGEGKGGTYGERAVEILAEALGKKKSIVYAYAQVARTWPEEKAFQKLVKRHGKFETGLSWTHILHLATVADADRRENLITQADKEGWSAQKLKANINPSSQYSQDVLPDRTSPESPSMGNGSSQGQSSEPQLPRAFQVAVEAMEAQVSALRANLDSFGKQMDRLIDEADPSDLNQALLDRVNQAREDLDALHKANMARFTQWIERIQAGCTVVARARGEWEPDAPGTSCVAPAIDDPGSQPASEVVT